jgi:hypothetical protein
MLERGYESFVGLIPVPYVHGMTMGELAYFVHDLYYPSYAKAEDREDAGLAAGHGVAGDGARVGADRRRTSQGRDVRGVRDDRHPRRAVRRHDRRRVHAAVRDARRAVDRCGCAVQRLAENSAA